MANVSKFPTSFTQTNYGGVPSWSNISNMEANDGSVSTIVLSEGELSQFFWAKDFNFGISPLATIDGIVFSMERFASSSNSIRDNGLHLYTNNLLISDNKSTSAYWSTSNGVETFGSPSDLWGRVGGISAELVNGLEFRYRCSSAGYGSNTGSVDYVEATVYYSIDGVKFSTSSLANITHGSTQIQKIYHGSNQIFPDDEPDAIAWANVSSSTSPVTSSTETFTGLNTSIPVQLTSSSVSAVQYILNGGSPVTFGGNNPAMILISNNDTLAFSYTTGKASSSTISVLHANKMNSFGNNFQLLSQFTLTKT